MVYHPDQSEKFSSYPDRCLHCAAPTLTDLRLAYDGNADIQWLVVQLSTFQEKINVQQKMTSFQIEMLSQTISQEFCYLKATEIMLFLSRLQGGAYAVDWYGSISPDKIISALREQFMPWRNHQFYLKEKEDEDKRREESINSPKNVTFEEWKKMKQDAGEEILHDTNPANIV